MANVLLGVTGSVAAIRSPALVAALMEAGHAVRVVATDSALYFFDPSELPHGILVQDADEWPREKYRRDDPVLHIELRRWAELLVVAPLDANTLAKFAVGLCDNCLCCVWRARDPARPVLLAPAMNTFMWQHPMTAQQIQQMRLDSGNVRVLGPVEKMLACGDVGEGAMAEVPDIVSAVGEMLG
ncbi:MAG: flavoprotein [Gemmataceae bacterium]